MKYFYIFCLLLCLSSCSNEERELLLKTQNEYILNLETQNKNLYISLEEKFRDNKLKFDSLNSLLAFNSSFRDLIKKPSIENQDNFNLKKSLLFEGNSYYRKNLVHFNESIPLPISKDSIYYNDYRIKLLEQSNKMFDFFIYSSSGVSCFGPPEYRVYYGNNYFIRNKALFKKGYFDLLIDNNFSNSINKIIIGKLDSTFNVPNYRLGFLSYYSYNENELRMEEVIESHLLDANGNINLNDFSDKCFEGSTIEGLARVYYNNNLNLFVPFRINFEE